MLHILRAVIQNVAVVGGIVILTRYMKQPLWPILIGATLLILGLVTLGVV
jgi:hypothetical protein